VPLSKHIIQQKKATDTDMFIKANASAPGRGTARSIGAGITVGAAVFILFDKMGKIGHTCNRVDQWVEILNRRVEVFILRVFF
jgi:hypothetical protein